MLPEWTGDRLFLDSFSKCTDSTAFSNEIDRLNENDAGHLHMVDMASIWLHLLCASFEKWARKEGDRLCGPEQAQLPLDPSLTDSYMVVDADGIEYVSLATEDEDVAMHDGDTPERIGCEPKVKSDWKSEIPMRRTQGKKTRRKVRKDIAVWSSGQVKIGDSDEVEIRVAKRQRLHSPQSQSKVTIQDEPAASNHASPGSSSLFIRGGYTGKKRLRRQPVVLDHHLAYLSLVPGDTSDGYFNVDVIPHDEDLGVTEAYDAIEGQARIADARNIKLLQRRRRKLYKESQADDIWWSTKAETRGLSRFGHCTTKAPRTPTSSFVRKALILSAGDSITQEDSGPNSVQRRESGWHASLSALPNRALVTHDSEKQAGGGFPASHSLQQSSRAATTTTHTSSSLQVAP